MKISLNINALRWPVLLLAAAFTVACGSSGGNDVVVDDDDFVVLPLYNYELTSTVDDPITVTAFGGLQLQLSHLGDGPGLFGAYQVDDGTFSVFEDSSLVVNELWPVFAGDGVYEESVELTWQEFDDLGDAGETPEWQLLGGFAYDATLEFMLELADIGISAFDYADDDLRQTGGQVVIQCDAFSDLGLSVPPAPPVFPDRGLSTFSWLDDAANGSVGPGDSFTWDFDYCLFNDETDDIDDLINGVVGLNSFTEVYEQRTAGETLVRIGWEGTGIAARPGGVHFSELERWEVFDADGDGAATAAAAELTSTVDGRMTLVFFEP